METNQLCQTATPEVNTSEVDSAFESAENSAVNKVNATSGQTATPSMEISRLEPNQQSPTPTGQPANSTRPICVKQDH